MSLKHFLNPQGFQKWGKNPRKSEQRNVAMQPKTWRLLRKCNPENSNNISGQCCKLRFTTQPLCLLISLSASLQSVRTWGKEKRSSPMHALLGLLTVNLRL